MPLQASASPSKPFLGVASASPSKPFLGVRNRLVLIDRRLPDSDGLSLIPVLRTRPPEPPVIVLTALDDIRERSMLALRIIS